MSHALVTVFMRESDTLEELMAPFDENLPFPMHEDECWREKWATDEHDENCCGGSLVVVTDSNPRGKWDYWRTIAEVRGSWDSARAAAYEPGMRTFAILLPGEGWIDREDIKPSYYDITEEGQAENERIWSERFATIYERAVAAGLTPAVCDYHS